MIDAELKKRLFSLAGDVDGDIVYDTQTGKKYFVHVLRDIVKEIVTTSEPVKITDARTGFVRRLISIHPETKD